MAKTKGVSDEEIISALLQYGTIKEAAKAAGISTRAIYNRMNDSEFAALYKMAKTDVLRQALFSMTGALSSAVDSITEIMTDKSVNPAIRLQAAQTVLTNVGKYTGILATSEQSARNETDICNQWFMR